MTSSPDILGLDIGGANLKAAHAQGVARTLPFALWKEPERLAEKLRELLAMLPAATVLAVTMTGELCDCFAGKEEGVRAILEAVEAIAEGREVLVWTTRSCFVDLAQARQRPLEVAAANWLALACCAAEMIEDQPGLLIDVGSTTTDIVPLDAGRPQPHGISDPERLRTRELVYCGVRRTPLCALLGLSAATEWFATTLDVYVTLGLIAEDAEERGTADGRPATREAAHARLAHMLCADARTCGRDETRTLAERVMQVHVDGLVAAVDHVMGRMKQPPRTAILSGSGAFLAERVLRSSRAFAQLEPVPKIVSLTQQWGRELSQAACAWAVVKQAACGLALGQR